MVVDTLYDVTCAHCGKRLSPDFNAGYQSVKALAEIKAKQAGFKYVLGQNVCRDCYTTVLCSKQAE